MLLSEPMRSNNAIAGNAVRSPRRAPYAAIYKAFATPDALETWLPPRGMTGSMVAFSFATDGPCIERASKRLRRSAAVHAER